MTADVEVPNFVNNNNNNKQDWQWTYNATLLAYSHNSNTTSAILIADTILLNESIFTAI